jgi:hypothetical protein
MQQMSKRATVNWTQLFPELKGNTITHMTRDSMVRPNGDRHYRVKLKISPDRLDEVQRKLAPHGFTVTVWPWLGHQNMLRVPFVMGLKCIRHEPA